MFAIYISIAGASVADAKIIFQDDSVGVFDSETIKIGSNDAGANNTVIQFGSDGTGSENGNIAWNISSNAFGVDHTVDITGGLSATGNVNFSGATSYRMREVATHTTATCTTVNELILNTTNSQVYKCTVTGTPGTWVSTETAGSTPDFEGVYTQDADKSLSVTDNLATAFEIKEGANSYMKLITTNGSEAFQINEDAYIGDNGDTVTINSSDWDISATGAMTGIGAITMDGLLTGTLGATLSGATINLNAGSNFATNIGTGGSNGAVSIGGNSNTVAVDGTNFDLTTAGAVTLTGHMTLSGDANEGLSGGGLTSCSAANQTLKWDSATNKFLCATNGNNTETFADTTPLATMVDNDNSEVFTGTIPSITTSRDDSTVLVTFSVRGTAADNDYESNAFQVARDTAAPSCPNTAVGQVVTDSSTDTGTIWTATGTFLDTPGNAGTYYYQVCTNSLSNSGNDTDATLNNVSMTLVELGN